MSYLLHTRPPSHSNSNLSLSLSHQKKKKKKKKSAKTHRVAPSWRFPFARSLCPPSVRIQSGSRHRIAIDRSDLSPRPGYEIQPVGLLTSPFDGHHIYRDAWLDQECRSRIAYTSPPALMLFIFISFSCVLFAGEAGGGKA